MVRNTPLPAGCRLPKLSDDPVRMYLSQMAEIPLLTREEEISLAKKIEVTRKRFRRTVLGCNFALQATVDTLEKVHRGVLPFDRTIKVSLTERLTKEQIMARMPHNLQTLEHLLEQNRADFRKLISRRTPRAERPKPASGFCRRRRKALTLVEELSLRTRRVQPLVQQMHEMSRRMDYLRARIEPLARAIRRAKDERANLRKRAARPDADHAGKPAQPAQPLRADRVGSSRITSRSSGSSPAATCGWWCRSPRSIATAA